ncbi:uncharacterized protein LOC131160081 [Malania oleifera]|uniref:uncharacterized protein LOC131160081 n=1 Tax=Malania oleifera TaxID=397392 RepID=UPI0025AE1947|nr:uncharacterized protein LOC131160081 [Malania oleifera]XP_057971386.1 uncharacterized protein LOC131160081 [Malania oleifera]XP_057971387.1 uncharacterized protein LOC131160081 [Malania oleifera]XP_057971388.1 uncharacterized protein LOC131160081 [Malania oleifera]XP_057971389.1 uncharacterized protein LOC131160081 [Malania oleifera]XP_057971390.1 uncharacterized protein LOC131160081 [Malania oleifera]XP_057971391.1 uncharacterized protein LOC131160081 [Malania oleifera]XP_057971392.1 unc
MDEETQSTSQNLAQFTVNSNRNGDLGVDCSDLLAACALCRRNFSPNNEAAGDLEAICGDCKFLLLEDHGTPVQDPNQMLSGRRRRSRRYSSSESIEDHFSQQFSQMINLARQNESTVFGHENLPVNGDAAAARLFQRTSSHTTPSGSRRWSRVLSDTESEGFDNLDSIYGESESSISFSGYRVFHGESDVISFSAYGGDSDASVDGHSFLDTEIFTHPDEGSDLDSDTDIDPMHAGPSEWNLDEEEDGEDDDDDGEWEEADTEENAVESATTGVRLPNFLTSGLGESIGHEIWRSLFGVPEFERVRWGIREGAQTASIFAGSEGSRLSRYVGNSGDYLDGRGFEELLENLAGADSLRRGSPPASASFVNNMPRMIVKEEHLKHDGLACAICKDHLSVGTEVNQLPCFHIYHPSCILPWLSARNSCPLCRYELPTDDKDYEEGKQRASLQMESREIQSQGVNEDGYSDVTDGGEVDEAGEYSQGRLLLGEPMDVDPAESDSSGRDGRRGRWFFLAAAAPIVSLVGMVLVLWLGNPLAEGRGSRGRPGFAEQGQRQNQSSPHRRENPSRRWWYLF